MTRMTTTRLTIFTAAMAGMITAGSGWVIAQTPETQLKAFDSPDQAVKALIEAAFRSDKDALTAILGSASQGIATSGDAAKDQEEQREFSKLASAKYHVEHSSIDSSAAVLLVGDEDWPFPIPLVKTGQKWHFDPELGAFEMRARRIGADELDTVEICKGYVNAQVEYEARTHAYAQKIMSSPGQKDGLYGPETPPELVPEGLALAAADLPNGFKRKPYHGYYFRVLTEQGPNAPGGAHKYLARGMMIGGFALMAWPADYGATGIHTFIVNQDGNVFEKDLGQRTAIQILSIMKYDPDGSWSPVDSLP